MSSTSMHVPVNEPLITDAAKRYVNDALESGWVSSAGPYLDAFEKAFAEYIGVKHAILTTGGTSALHLALVALKIGPGDEVIVPDFTMIASAFAVMYTGATPVFVDVDSETYNIDPTLIKAKITPRTKAIMPVHIYGHSADMDPIMEIAATHGLSVIEDAAEIHGGTYRGKKCGSIGTINAFSFYGNKIITTGEGGMVCTNDDTLADYARRLKDLAHKPGHRFLHEELGWNYRMTNLQAGLGLGQLESIETFLETKRHMASVYGTRLQDISGLRLPVTRDYAENVYWMYAVLVEDSLGMTRDTLRSALKEHGIDTRDFFLPCHSQPAVTKAMAGKPVIQQQITFPVTEDIARRGFYLPSGLAITDEQLDYVCATLHDLCQ